MDLQAEQEAMMERNQEREKDRAAFVIINLFPSDGKRFKFAYAPSVLALQAFVKDVMPDAFIVREYRCHPENEEFVLARVRNTRGVVMQNRTVADIHNPLQVIGMVDELSKKNDLSYKMDH